MMMWAMSDRAIPRSVRFMEGFGVHTFRLVNSDGKSKFVKFHWKPKQGLQSVVWGEAVKINGADPDFHRRDLWEAIQKGSYPEWELGMQIFDEDFANKFPFSILDATKIIPEEDVPVRRVGKMVLNKWVDNDFHETEQAAFCTQNIIPGIDFTNDPLLQGRNFSYLDTQLKRLGSPNFTQIPINRPKGCPVMNFHQDGQMNMRNVTGRVNYEPNSLTEGSANPKESYEGGFHTYPEQVAGPTVRERPEMFADHYSQARQFWISQTRVERQHIINAYMFELSKVKNSKIRERVVGHLLNIDSGLAHAVARGLGLQNMPEAIAPARPPRMDLKPSKPLSIVLNGPGNMSGRKLGIMVSEGADIVLLAAFNALCLTESTIIEYITKNVEGIRTNDGSFHRCDETLLGAPSVLYDAVVIILSESEAKDYAANLVAREFVTDAYMHCKFIAYNEPASALISAAGIDPTKDQGMMKVTNPELAREWLNLGRAKTRFWERGELVPETA
jgi:catalase